MNETRIDRQTALIFTLLQAATVGIALVGLALAVFFSCVGVVSLIENTTAREPGYLAFTVLAMLAVAVVTLCSLAALYEFFMMCRRLKQGTAFTERNRCALNRIALLCAVSGGAILATFIIAVMLCWPCGGNAFMLLTALVGAAYLCVALVAWALAMLVKRATALQQESELTI